jgi:hypothetical protein
MHKFQDDIQDGGLFQNRLVHGHHFFHSVCRPRDLVLSLLSDLQYHICTSTSFEGFYLYHCKSNKNSKALVQEAKTKDGQEITFLRLPLAYLVASQLVCDDWATIYNSKHFQSKCNIMEACIVINNHNLDMGVLALY